MVASGRLAAERHPAREDLEDHDAERVDVAAEVDLLAARLLRAHVLGRAHDEAGRGRRGRGGAPFLGDPEVHQPDLAARVAHDVGRLQVAVDDAHVVDRAQAVRELQRRREGLLDRQPAALAQDLAQVDALHVLHRDVAQALVLAVLVDAADVLVADAPGQLDLGLEAPGDLGIARDLRPQHLDRDVLVEQPVVGAVDDAHAALAELLLDLVAAGHDGAQTKGGRQGLPACEAGLGRVVVGSLAGRTDVSHGARGGPSEDKPPGSPLQLRPDEHLREGVARGAGESPQRFRRGRRGLAARARATRSFATSLERCQLSR